MARDDAPQPVEGGLDLRGLIRSYGPMAAAAAAAVPAIMFTRGRGGQEILNIIRRLAPKHAEAMQASKIPYFLEMNPKNLTSFASAPFSHPRLPEDILDLVKFARGKGVTAPYIGRVNVSSPQHIIGSSLHEFGHAVGFDRAAQKLAPTTPLELVDDVGSKHLDQISNPRVHEMVKNALQKSPYLKDYYSIYSEGKRQRGLPQSQAWGELVNEAWTERLQRRAGLKPEAVTDIEEFRPWLPRVPELNRKFGLDVDEAVRSGRLRPTHESSALDALRDILSRYAR